MTDYRLTSTMNMWTDDNTSMMEAFMTSDLTSLWPPPPSSSASTSIHLPPLPPIAPFNPDTLQQRLQALIEGARENWTYAIFWKSTTNDFPGGPGPVLARGDGYYKGEEDKGKRIKASTSAEEQAHRKKVLRELNSLISGASPPENDAVDEEVTDTEWFFLVSMTQSFGPGFGLPGQAMYNSSLIWVAGAELLSGSHCERADLITMSVYSAKRRLKDLKDLGKSGYIVVLTFEALSVDEVVKSFVDRLGQTVGIDDMDFIVQLEGPKETLYEGGTWKVRVKFPDAYPYRPPSLAFVDPIFHPNISKSGGICVDLLGSKWDAGFNLLKVFREILPGLLVQPNPASPYNQEAAELMLADETAYAERVRSYHHAR